MPSHVPTSQYMLGYTSSNNVKFSVFLMVFGAVVAAIDDLSFDLV